MQPAAAQMLSAGYISVKCTQYPQAGRPHDTSADVHEPLKSFWRGCMALISADWYGLCRWPCPAVHSSQH